MSDLGNLIRQRREALGLTVREVGERAGMSGGYVSQIENGKVGIPTPNKLRFLARALRLPELALVQAIGFLQDNEQALADVLSGPEPPPPSEAWRRLVAQFGGDERVARRWLLDTLGTAIDEE